MPEIQNKSMKFLFKLSGREAEDIQKKLYADSADKKQLKYLEQENSELKSRISRLEKALEEEKLKAGYSDDDYQDKINNIIKEFDSKSNELKSRISKLEKVLEEANNKTEQLQTESDERENLFWDEYFRRTEANDEINKLKKELENKNTEIKNIKDSINKKEKPKTDPFEVFIYIIIFLFIITFIAGNTWTIVLQTQGTQLLELWPHALTIIGILSAICVSFLIVYFILEGFEGEVIADMLIILAAAAVLTIIINIVAYDIIMLVSWLGG